MSDVSKSKNEISFKRLSAGITSRHNILRHQIRIIPERASRTRRGAEPDARREVGTGIQHCRAPST